jgi:endonuclease YncB( thermonuclease family)
MPFTLIKGRFKPGAGIPDGDSVRFLANNLGHWSKLAGKPPELGTGAKTLNTVQLRYEGIDAIEKGAIQPLATEARDSMFKLIGYDKTNNPDPAGYVLSRETDDRSGRPICFAFAGNTHLADGSEVRLEAPLLRRSVNWLQMKAGYAYPLYYNTLFAALRREFDKALALAKAAKDGYWAKSPPNDCTLKGVTVRGKTDLKTISPIWPKLWRRLEEWFRKHNSLNGFVAFLAAKNERIDILSIMEERGLQDLVKVTGDKVQMIQSPENLRVVGSSGRRHR